MVEINAHNFTILPLALTFSNKGTRQDQAGTHILINMSFITYFEVENSDVET